MKKKSENVIRLRRELFVLFGFWMTLSVQTTECRLAFAKNIQKIITHK